MTLTGAALGAVSLLFPLVSLKENRVADGIGQDWISLCGFVPPLIYLILLIFFSLCQKDSKGLLRPLLLVLLFLPPLLTAGPLAARGLTVNGRISLSWGFWIFLLSYSLLVQDFWTTHSSSGQRILFLIVVPFPPLIIALTGGFSRLSLTLEFLLKRKRVFSELFSHISLAGTALGVALIIGIPLAILAYRRDRWEKLIFAFLGGVQTIPSLALFGLLIAPLSYLSFRYPILRDLGIRGIGRAPALIALSLYALLPIARNCYTALSSVDPSVIQAGRGMGMNSRQLFFKVELPMALPIILAGIRTAAIQAVGNTAVAALIGAGGLGIFVFQGLGQGAPDLILLGVIPLLLLALFVDRFLILIISLTVSKGLRMDTEGVSP